MCEHEFIPNGDSSKRFRATEDDAEEEEEEEEDDYQDYDDYDNEIYESPMLKTKDQKRKTVEAIEKPMNEKELKSYFDKYMSVLKEQRLQTKKFSDKDLHKIIFELFQSLQYKEEKPEG